MKIMMGLIKYDRVHGGLGVFHSPKNIMLIFPYTIREFQNPDSLFNLSESFIQLVLFKKKDTVDLSGALDNFW